MSNLDGFSELCRDNLFSDTTTNATSVIISYYSLEIAFLLHYIVGMNKMFTFLQSSKNSLSDILDIASLRVVTRSSGLGYFINWN